MITKQQKSIGRHALPDGVEFTDRDVSSIYARVRDGVMPSPGGSTPHAATDLEMTRPMMRIQVIAHSSLDLAAELYKAGASTSFARIDREACSHCQEVGHITAVRFYPNPDPEQPGARDSVPDACGCCAPKVLAELLAESGGADVAVEVWHPRPKAVA